MKVSCVATIEMQLQSDSNHEDAFANLSNAGLREAKKNVARAREHKTKDQQFKPRNDQLLVDWLKDAKRYNEGPGIEANNWEINPDNNQPWLTDEAFIFIHPTYDIYI